MGKNIHAMLSIIPCFSAQEKELEKRNVSYINHIRLSGSTRLTTSADVEAMVLYSIYFIGLQLVNVAVMQSITVRGAKPMSGVHLRIAVYHVSIFHFYSLRFLKEIL